MIKAIFLDRDGVINHNENGSPKTMEEFKLKPNVELALEILNGLGYFNIVVTNQPDVERGLLTKEFVIETFDYIQNKCKVHKFYVCPFADDSNEFKKPNIGMLKKAELENKVNLKESFLVGDTWRDIDAGIRAGCTTIYMAQEHNYEPEVAKKANYVVEDIMDVVNIVVDSDYQVQYFNAVYKLALSMRTSKEVSKLIDSIVTVKENKGRIFFIGSVDTNCTVYDFNESLGISTKSLYNCAIIESLKEHKLSGEDVIFILSVGGGSKERNVDTYIVDSVDYAKNLGAKVLGIVGLKEGYTYKNGDCIAHIPAIFPKGVTPLTKSFQNIILNMLVTHPKLQEYRTSW